MRVRKKTKDVNSDANKILTDETKQKASAEMPPELEIKSSKEEVSTEKGVDERQLEEEMEIISDKQSGQAQEKKSEDI